ncbi:sensor histidine kinase [Desulfosporosinus acididurans]|uniref:sensor histidine kinase n=1 Tax=Desulfosporosinus acididurans TaxID=476652 RepID=UPI0013792651|nr:HAMP domain-containing sensor histidine kinase [Desulfosporosinus acididurans]
MLSNILMIIIPAVLIMIVTGIVYLSYLKISKGASVDDAEKYIAAQSMIAEYSNQMQYSQTIYDFDAVQSELQKRLLASGIYSKITRDHQIVASNFTKEVDSLSATIDGPNSSMPKPYAVQSGHALLISYSFPKDSYLFKVIAIDPNFRIRSNEWVTRIKVMGSYITITFIISLIIIALTNGVISSNIFKNIIVPLDMLNYGAEQIKNGNLDFEIKYERMDEFGVAIANFDEMRTRLRQSIQTQLNYEEERKELVAGISHDLRTPLTAIKGYVKGLKDNVANTPEKQQRYHDIIYKKTCEMDVLVDRLFLFSKLDTGHLPFYFEKVKSKEYFGELVRQIIEDFEGSGLKLSYSNRCSSNSIVTIDPDQMKRVFTNIVENSLKYKQLESCQVDFMVSRQGNEVVIEICDDGQGVPEEILPKLFTSFYRGDASRNNPTQSSGLGLSIAERIVKAHHGSIIAQNKNGLAITIKLPVVEVG